MAGTVAWIGRRMKTIVVLTSWGGCLAVVVALRFVVFDSAICEAAEPPTVAQFRRDHSDLRTASSNVQGEFRVFRSETANPAALEKLPSDIGIPLIRSGTLWRSVDKVRADYTSYHPHSEVAKETQHSFAVDGGKVYEFSSGLDPDTGTLRVYDMDTPEAANAMNSIEHTTYQPLDALWSCYGTAFVDMLQRPGAEIVPSTSQMLPGGFSMLVPAGDGNEVRFEFAAAKFHPFGYLLASEREGDLQVTVERRVYWTEKEGALLPSRVVEVSSLGPDSGYTEVVMLNLKPLEADSPIASDITSASFRNFGLGYQVYNFRKGKKEELAERYERNTR